MAAGVLTGAACYSALGHSGHRRVWLVGSLTGVTTGFITIGSLGPVWVVFAGGFLVGTSSSNFSSRLGVLLVE